MLAKVRRRFKACWSVLLGERPAEVRFDVRDNWIAEIAAMVAADAIHAELEQRQRGIEGEWDWIHPKVRAWVYRAILDYVTHDRELADLAARNRKSTDDDEPIPF